MRRLLIAHVEPAQREDKGDFYYRTQAPCRAMAELDGVSTVSLSSIHRKRDEIFRRADVLVLKNVCDPDILPLLAERRRNGKLSVYEVADDLEAVPPWNPVYFFYKNPENLSLFRTTARSCDALQFTVAELERIYGHLNARSAVFPNNISEVPPERRSGGGNRIIIGWGGSHGHLEDIRDIAGPLARWIINTPGVILYIMCSDPIWELFGALPAERKRRFPTGSIHDYYSFLKKIDVGIAPLRDTPFNRSRSDIKFLEYAVHGAVPVIQNLTPYRYSARPGETCFLFGNSGELIGILERLAADGSLRNAVAESARSYVLRERIESSHSCERVAFYEDLRREMEPTDSSAESEDIIRSAEKWEGTSRNGRYARLIPTRFENLLHDGLVYLQIEKDPVSAKECFRQASAIEPDNYLPHLYSSACSADPIKDLIRADGKNPRSIKAQIMMGGEYAKRRDYRSAMSCFEKAASIFPGCEIPYLRAADVLDAIGNRTAAAEIRRKACLIAERDAREKNPCSA
ncbi:MAG TPA: glycosyltransferase [Syntrophales bacterium]|nr:glycosyltransferase [Syntrophales bacterium]